MKKLIYVVFFLGISLCSYGQNEDLNQNKKTEFGFNIGGFQTLLKSDKFLPENYEINNSTGFRLGVLMNHNLGEKFSISPKAELGFSSSNVSYFQEPDINISKPIYNTHLEFMTHLIWRRTNLNVNPYILVGPSIRVPLTKENEVSFTNSFDAGIDIGIGFHKSLNHFKILPELRLSTGFMNIMKEESSPNIRYTSISLVLNFIG